MTKSLIVFVLFSLVMFAGNVRADSRGHGAKEFYSHIEDFRKSCSNKCQAPFRSETLFDIQFPGQSHLQAEVQSNLSNVAFLQAQIWGDTILEGDYYSAGQTQLDRVIALLQNDVLIGYKITYSERAWFVGDCSFDGNNETTLKACSEGRIHESTFVSPDFKTFFRDDEDFADFIN